MDKIRVMIVEDSAVVRQFLQHVIGNDPRLQVVAAVESAEEALRLLARVSPDVISMDIHLPGMNGFEATRRIMEERPTPIVVVSGSILPRDVKSSIEALRAGALTVVEKPVGTSHADYATLAERLCTQLAIMSQVQVIRQRFNGRDRALVSAVPQAAHRTPLRGRSGQAAFAMLGIVASTGGPNAVQSVLNALGPGFPLPVLLVQHITMSFHDSFVAWLNDVSPFSVLTACAGQVPRAGHVYVAPADRHVEVQGRTLGITCAEPICAQRPSGTVLFRSMARSLGTAALAVILTGMGEDGAVGLRDVRESGGYTLGEDESTAVVYGMPAAAARLKALCESLPLAKIGPRIIELVSCAGSRTTLSSGVQKV